MLTFDQLLFVLLILALLFLSKNYQEPFRMVYDYTDHYAFRNSDDYQPIGNVKKP